ncbi:MAG: CDP-paratose 2-epimerase [Parcubacteria group bacterium Athens1014_10]|nr:MAG: CDP-paratose 2-epimerase [Parcubacteria group bacterium Athens1014_10]
MNKILITGGAGFIGINSAKYFLDKGFQVFILDNFIRLGTKENVEWLKKNASHDKLKIIKADIKKDYGVLKELAESVDAVLHLAAQVAVTTSVKNPREDFEINALGTLNILEAIRESKKRPSLIYSSTNKVYGAMEDVKIIEVDERYQYQDLPYGAVENRVLDFHSPYGCSKGAADQYVRDYNRIYGLKTIVFRQSCIYGPCQFGVEDQGWVAWFIISSLLGRPLTIYGDGKQVRDVLFINDLIEAYWLALENLKVTSGKIYNIGGGRDNQLSLLQLINLLENFLNKKIDYKFTDWRPGDQPVFICDIRKAERDIGWRPKHTPNQGVEKLIKWTQENLSVFQKLNL